MTKAEASIGTARPGPSHLQFAEKATDWRLGQVLRATVIGGKGNGPREIMIGNKAYTAAPDSLPDTGTSLILKVKSLQPQIRLTIMNTAEIAPAKPLTPASVLSDYLLQKTEQTGTRSLMNLLTLMNSASYTTHRSLTAEAQMIFQGIEKKVLNFNALSDAKQLKAALLDSGLLLESKLAAANNSDRHSDTDLKALLFQLFKSLQAEPISQQARQIEGRQPLALLPAGYLFDEQNPDELMSRLMRAVEEAFAGIVSRQKNSLHASTETRQCWFFELPVKYESQYLSIPITLYRDREQSSEVGQQEPRWGVEFSLDLKNTGFIQVQMRVSSSEVAVVMRADQLQSTQILNEYRDTLNKRLQNNGLLLREFSCQTAIAGQA